MTTIALGGNIILNGFQDREFSELIVVKKIVGQYARRLSDGTPGFSGLSVRLSEVHGGTKFEIHAAATVEGQECNAVVTDHNLFVALDSALKRVAEQVQKAHEKRAQH